MVQQVWQKTGMSSVATVMLCGFPVITTVIACRAYLSKLVLPPSPSFENSTLTREFIIEHLFSRCKEYFHPLEKAAFFAALMIVCDSQIQLFTVLRLSRLHSLIPSSPPKYKYYGKNYDLLFLLNSSNILLSICMFKYSLRNASIS